MMVIFELLLKLKWIIACWFLLLLQVTFGWVGWSKNILLILNPLHRILSDLRYVQLSLPHWTPALFLAFLPFYAPMKFIKVVSSYSPYSGIWCIFGYICWCFPIEFSTHCMQVWSILSGLFLCLVVLFHWGGRFLYCDSLVRIPRRQFRYLCFRSIPKFNFTNK